jgi:hypothetical protein
MAASAAQQHRAASLVLFERLAEACGRPACYGALRSLLDRPTAPQATAQRGLTLEYDFYLGRRGGSVAGAGAAGAWGVTLNDAHEGGRHARDVLRFARSLGGRYQLSALSALAERVRGADVSLTFAVGFDGPSSGPRLKFYFQERSWNAGVLRWAQLGPLLASLVPGFEPPSFVPPARSVGVVAVDLTPNGDVAVKVYLGGESLPALVAGAPAEVGALADDMARVCPLAGQFHYLTVRGRPGQAPSYSVNKIYAVTALIESQRTELAWEDAAGLFALTGDRATLDKFRSLSAGLLALPTATALEDQSRAADLYVAAVRLAP